MLHVGTFSETSPSLCITHRIDTHGKAYQQCRCRCCTAAEHAVCNVRAILERQHRDRFLCGIDDPVLGDTRFSIVGALDHRVALDIVGADDLHHEVRAEPEGILIPRVVDIEEQYQIWLAKTAWRDTHP